MQGFSRAQIESAATGAYGATISQYKVTVGAWSNTGTDVTTPVFAESGTKTVFLEATDSRGRKSADTKTFAVIPYSLPALNNPIVHRSNDIGAAAYLGTYLYIKTGFSISPLGGTPDVNAATLSARIYQKGTTPPAWGDAGDVTITAGADNTISGLSISYSYSVDIRVVDKLGNYTYSLVIPSSSVSFSLKAGGLGAAFGKFAELDDALEISWSKGWLGGNPIAAYRVGSVFVTFESESPATLFPGTTWQKLGAGQFLVSAGTGYTAGNTGGEATHTLTAAETPKLSVTTYDGSEYVRMAASRQLGATGGTYAVPFAGTWSSSILKTDGGGGAHNNMPPWIAVNIWRRTA